MASAGLVIAGMLALIVVRVPIGGAMFIAGAAGFWALVDYDPLMSHLRGAVWARFSNYDLSVIPLFVLMGHFAAEAGFSRALFRAAHAFVGHLRGGIAMSAIVACAAFGTICGSSDPDEKSIWFGILMLSVIQIGLILPPVALDIYVVNSFVRDVRVQEIYRGVMPFVTADIAWGVGTYTPGRFPLMEVFELPFVAPSAEVAARAAWRFAAGRARQEWTEIHLITLPMFYTTPQFFAMNRKKYDSLPADLRKVIDDNGGEKVAGEIGRIWDQSAEPVRKAFRDRGNTIVDFQQAEMERWVKAAQPAYEEWIKFVGERGHDGKAVLDEARTVIKEIAATVQR